MLLYHEREAREDQRRRAMRHFMNVRRYPRYCQDRVVEWIDSIDDPIAAPAPWIRCADLAGYRNTLAPFADLHDGGPENWPSWTDADRWEPTDSDRDWWVAQTTATAEMGVSR
jgi:hypothetical protein